MAEGYVIHHEDQGIGVYPDPTINGEGACMLDTNGVSCCCGTPFSCTRCCGSVNLCGPNAGLRQCCYVWDSSTNIVGDIVGYQMDGTDYDALFDLDIVWTASGTGKIQRYTDFFETVCRYQLTDVDATQERYRNGNLVDTKTVTAGTSNVCSFGPRRILKPGGAGCFAGHLWEVPITYDDGTTRIDLHTLNGENDWEGRNGANESCGALVSVTEVDSVFGEAEMFHQFEIVPFKLDTDGSICRNHDTACKNCR